MLAGKDTLQGKVFFLDNKNFPVSALKLTHKDKIFKSSFTIPDSARAFYVVLQNGGDIDNNSDAGYVYLVYKDKTPVPGAYAFEATMLSNGMGNALAKIKMIKNADALALFQKELDLHPESINTFDEIYYAMLARSTDSVNKEKVKAHIAVLEKMGTEKSLQVAASLYNVQRKKASADSLNSILLAKYPNGDYARLQLYRTFSSESNLNKRDSIYAVFLQKFPAKPGETFSYSDVMAANLAEAYSKNGDWENSDKYIAAINSESEKQGTYNDVAYEMAKKGENLDDAAKLSKESLDMVQASIDNPKPGPYRTAEDVKMNASYTYYLYADTYALILFKQGKSEEALKYQQQVYDHTKPLDAEEMEHYLVILNSLGKYQQAKAAAEENIKAGKSSDIIEQEYKKAYVKVTGSDKDYNKSLAALQLAAKEKAKEELAKTMMNKPAPLFALKDFDGKTVSLSDLKGKVVVVDFWATWCGPCKASFPGMQMAVNKFKDNPNVKFLFVDCSEVSNTYVNDVKKFIADNKYTFHVLFDEKNSEGRQQKVMTDFGVSGIPTKFIIDKNGNIRFTYVGFSGSDSGVLDEVSNMIELTENPDSIPGQKVSMNK